MKAKTVQIYWHDKQPIFSVDFEPCAPGRLATCGADANIWKLVDDANGNPQIDFLSNLSRHTASVNVVRWAPTGGILASAGDDGTVIVWKQQVLDSSSSSHQQSLLSGTHSTSQSGSSSSSNSNSNTQSLVQEEYDEFNKETWKIQLLLRGSGADIYDVAWSPDATMIMSGSIDNTVRIYDTITGKCLQVLADHSHFVQGVAWDPLGKYLASQSSDRSVLVYSYEMVKPGVLKTKLMSKFNKLSIKDSNGANKNSNNQQQSSGISGNNSDSGKDLNSEDQQSLNSTSSKSASDQHHQNIASTASTLGMSTGYSSSSTHELMPPPPQSPFRENRRSSTPTGFNSSVTVGWNQTNSSNHTNTTTSATTINTNAPNSPRFSRSPSRSLNSTRLNSSTGGSIGLGINRSFRMYHDETLTSFFRRLSFLPDGSLLLTPASQIKVVSAQSKAEEVAKQTQEEFQNTVYVYARGRLDSDPIAHLPGFKRPSIAIRACSIPYQMNSFMGTTATSSLRSRSVGDSSPTTPTVSNSNTNTNGNAQSVAEEGGFSSSRASSPTMSRSLSMLSNASGRFSQTTSDSPRTLLNGEVQTGNFLMTESHQLQQMSVMSEPVPLATLQLGYRFVYAVATQDSVLVYDTQNPKPLCSFSNLHYATFTDLAWSHDGHALIMASTDGFCSIASFDTNELGEPMDKESAPDRIRHLCSEENVFTTTTNNNTANGNILSSSSLKRKDEEPEQISNNISSSANDNTDNSRSNMTNTQEVVVNDVSNLIKKKKPKTETV